MVLHTPPTLHVPVLKELYQKSLLKRSTIGPVLYKSMTTKIHHTSQDHDIAGKEGSFPRAQQGSPSDENDHFQTATLY